jgi:hypothetical protein
VSLDEKPHRNSKYGKRAWILSRKLIESYRIFHHTKNSDSSGNYKGLLYRFLAT